jgi:hypothetical protein
MILVRIMLIVMLILVVAWLIGVMTKGRTRRRRR